jgi:thiol-disulfide isomerase/thioredoxin
MKRLVFASLLLAFASICLAGCLQSRQSDDPKVKEKSATPAEVALKQVKFKEMTEAIQANQGKIVVIDVWASFCIPCKKEFHHLVEMHDKYAGKGVVCMSACVDDLKDEPAALKFLQSKNAAFANYLFTDEKNVWQDVWEVTAIPAVMVYDQAGKLRRFTMDDPDHQFTYADVEKHVQSLLAAK